MEQQKLPNSTLILVFGIISIVTCCCWGILGLIFGIITIVLAKKATTVYMENPEQYSGFQNVKTGKILAYIGIALNIIYLGYTIYVYFILGVDGMMDIQNSWIEKLGG
jgi:M penetrans paralogue family 26